MENGWLMQDQSTYWDSNSTGLFDKIASTKKAATFPQKSQSNSG